jgi:hypothetical protein
MLTVALDFANPRRCCPSVAEALTVVLSTLVKKDIMLE